MKPRTGPRCRATGDRLKERWLTWLLRSRFIRVDSDHLRKAPQAQIADSHDSIAIQLIPGGFGHSIRLRGALDLWQCAKIAKRACDSKNV